MTYTANVYRGIRVELNSSRGLSGIHYRQLYSETVRLQKRLDEAFDYMDHLERNIQVCTVADDWARSTNPDECCPAVRRLRAAITDIVHQAFALPDVMGEDDADDRHLDDA